MTTALEESRPGSIFAVDRLSVERRPMGAQMPNPATFPDERSGTMSLSRRHALKRMLAAAGASIVPLQRSVGAAAAGFTSARTRELEPFQIDVPPEMLQDLNRRIDATRWPDIPFETGWNAGTDNPVLRELVDYWRHEYDWSRVQSELNELTHLRGPIDGEQLHLVTYSAVGTKHPFPLLLLHGWPGSFREFTDAAPLLTASREGDPGFDLVVPSLPGFVFSEAPREPGMNPGRMAERLHLLMRELGHVRYGVQGGDWGAIIGTQLARRYPDAVVGLHLTFVASAPQPPDGTTPSAEEEEYRAYRARFQGDETGYSAIQGTRPESLSYALQDSPVGWLAWMLEKYYAWSDHRGDLWSVFDRDAILTTAMLYWLPGRILSAARIYYETSYRPQPGSLIGGHVRVPTGYAHFPAEPWGPPPEVVERTYNLVHYTRMLRGGHFPALEQPEPWAGDVAKFFSNLSG